MRIRTSVALLPLLVAGCVRGELIVEPVPGPDLVYTRTIPGAGSGASISPSGTLLASIDTAGRVVIVDVASGMVARRIANDGGRSTYHATAFSPDGQYIAAVGKERSSGFSTIYTVDLWNVQNGTLWKSIESTIRVAGDAVAYDPSGRTIAVLRGDQISIVEISSGLVLGSIRQYLVPEKPELQFISSTQLLQTDGDLYDISGGHSTYLQSVGGNRWRATPDATRVISVSRYGERRDATVGFVNIASLPGGADLGSFSIDDPHVDGLAISNDGEHFVFGRTDLRLYRVRDGGFVRRVSIQNGPIGDLFFTPDGLQLVATANGSYHVYTFQR